MEMLILGGTEFLGKELTHAALAGGWDVTCVARGTNSTPPDAARFVRSDRTIPGALAQVCDRVWDCVIELGTSAPQVRAATVDVRADHYVFVSSASVYTQGDVLEQDETSATYEPLTGDVFGPAQYGAAKRACEVAVQAVAEPWLVVRPALIGGPGDRTDRSGYWPWRFANPVNGKVAVPQDPTQPIALLDVRDLAAWLVVQADQKTHGIYNAAGHTTTLGHMLAVSAEAANSSAVMVPVAPSQLTEAGVTPWAGPHSMPLWLNDPAARCLATLNSDKAVALGLQRRPLLHTLKDALTDITDRGGPAASGLTSAQEYELHQKV